MATYKTKAPTGLTITRKNLNLVCTWKVGDENYGNTQFRWRTKKRGKAVSGWDWDFTEATTYTLDLEMFGENLERVDISVAGLRDNTSLPEGTSEEWSDYVSKSYTIGVPNVPSLSQKLSDDYDNETTFTWNTTVDEDDNKPFDHVEWQTLLVKESNVTDGSKLAWKSSALSWEAGTGTRASSKTKTEESTLLAQNAYTRWFRVRAVGFGGASAWRYAKHVYAMPWVPKINKVAKEGDLNWIRVNWTAEQSAAHPIDITQIDWTIGTPQAGRTAPANPSWTTARTIRDTAGTDEVSFLVDQQLDYDECLWVRVSVQHDRNLKTTGARLVSSGRLTAPSGLSVQTNTSTYRATITATNNSDVPDSQLAVVLRRSKQADIVVGIIPNGSDTVTVQCPDWSGASAVAFGVYAFQGSAVRKTAGGVSTYAVTANMKSGELWDGGSVPLAPTSVTAEPTEIDGEVLLTWSWAWTSANRAEISWSQNPNAWESTDEPETYMITNVNAPKWRVSGLETGVLWYFRIRLAQETGDDITYGPYCENISVDLSAEPNIPVLTLSEAAIPAGGSFSAGWVFVTNDGTSQRYAEICEATITGDTITYGAIFAHAGGEQHIIIDAPSTWGTGTVHSLCVRVVSESGRVSGWSYPASIAVADPIECEITQTSLQEVTIGEGTDAQTFIALTAMPLTATVIGAGVGGRTTLVIERADDYFMLRPDETELDGYNGETIAVTSQDGERQITIGTEDLIGRLDDGAPYKIIATTQDGYGQTAVDEIRFIVAWTHQAEIPTATVTIEDQAVKITPIAPENIETGDVCDIYRLSADRPELIVQGGVFGETYVDPYPAIGEHGGHRVVHRTVNGDYITADNRPAWTDLGQSDGDMLDADFVIIDFGEGRIEIPYNVAIDNTWQKDFSQTTYLGGSTQGDWNSLVNRTGSVSASVVTDDEELIKSLRRLAVYPGLCHIRTQDGSSYAADIQVNDGTSYDTAGKILELSLSITRVDHEGFDGMTLEAWEARG